jgi:hypothetical protein
MRSSAKIIIVCFSIILLASTTIIVLWSFVFKAEMFYYDFETALDGWIGDADYLVGENDSIALDWNVTRKTENPNKGSYSICLEIDGTQDDGAVWIERVFLVSPDDVNTKHVKVSFYIYSDNFGMNTRALIFASVNSTNPSKEEDFDHRITTITSDSYLDGWYKFSITTKILPVDQIWVAIGIKVAWETFLEFYIDDVSVRIR